MAKSLTLRVWRFHCAGLAPSQIDRKLSLASGTAHDEVVNIWAYDNLTKGQYILELSAGRA